MFLTYHSYGQYVLHTWGYRRGTPPNEAELREMGNIAAQAMQGVNGNNYEVGGAADLLYAAAGTKKIYQNYAFRLHRSDFSN